MSWHEKQYQGDKKEDIFFHKQSPFFMKINQQTPQLAQFAFY
jgi:hypothetical protein